MTTTMTQQFARSPLAAALTLATTAFLYAPAATAQTPPAPAASEAVSDRVKKDAAGPLYWIRLNAQKSDAPGTKAAPRITEVRTEPRVLRAAPLPAQATATVAPPTTPPVRSTTAVAASLGYLPAEASARDAAASGSDAPQVNTAAAEAAPNTAATASPAGVAGAGTVAPSGPGAAEAARAAATAAATEDDPDDQPLALMKAEEPEFPANMMRKLRKGTVQVRFEVQADGTVANAAVLQTSHRSLNEAAISAVNGWRFQPVRSPRSAVVDLGFDLDG